MRTFKAQTTGERLFKAVEISIFTPENKRIRQRHVAPPRQGINEKGIEILLRKTADKIEKSWPDVDYSLVELGANRFNFVPRPSAI